MKMHESAENYLEAILILKNKNGYVRSIDIANYLNFTKPSVSIAMKSLKNDGYISSDEDGSITLTDKGAKIADKIYERHTVIAKGLMSLGVSEDTAYEDSCKIEHDISVESFDKIKEHLYKHKLIDKL